MRPCPMIDVLSEDPRLSRRQCGDAARHIAVLVDTDPGLQQHSVRLIQ